MIDTKELRQLAQAATPGPWFSDARGNIWRRPLSDLYENGGSVAGDKPIAFVAAGWRGEGVTGYPVENNARLIAASNPSAVIELLDRLEAAEADALEQARLNGMGASREAALMAKLEAAEKERDELRNEIACVKEVEFPRKAQAVADAWKGKCERLEAERDALRARIEAMERQEPVGVLHVGNYYGEELQDWEFEANQCACDKLNEVYVSNPTSLPLYALHGAQPAPSLASNDVSLISEGKTQPAQSVKDVIIDDLQSQFDTEGITEHDSGDALIRLSDTIAAVEDNFAQPAPIEQDTSVRKAWARFSNELHRSPDAPYPGMSEAFEKHFSQSFTDREWRAESGVWAAAWKAAKNHGAQPAPSIPDGWLRAIDEALVVAHIGVANESDTYEQAKAKLDTLIGLHVDIATDPAVNGGWKLVPIEPTQEMSEAGVYAGSIYYDVAEATYEAMLAAAPEAKL